MNPLAANCPGCGAEVSFNAKGCPKCGAKKENCRWIGAETHDGLDLPDDEFDYEDFVAREFGQGSPKRDPKKIFWWIVALITLVAFALLAIGGL
ncbi:MAG: hypothetical protein WD342_10750 [Verrucomicrobiales bacterium]